MLLDSSLVDSYKLFECTSVKKMCHVCFLSLLRDKMNSKPSIIIDKSVIQGLTGNEIQKLSQHIKFVVTPPLIREIHSNLYDPTLSSEQIRKKVSIFANKLMKANPTFQYSIESIVIADLLGCSVPIDGKPLLFASSLEHTPQGIYVKESQPSKILRRWSIGNYENNDFDIGEVLKTFHESVDLNVFKDSLLKMLNPPIFKSLESCNQWINQMLTEVDQEEFLRFLLQSIRCSETDEITILDRWQKSNIKLLKDFSLAGHCFLNILTFLCLGISSNLILSSRKAKAHIDIEYVAYLPYSNGISSDDKLFKDFYDIFSRKDQIFITGKEIRQRLKEIDEAKRSKFL